MDSIIGGTDIRLMDSIIVGTGIGPPGLTLSVAVRRAAVSAPKVAGDVAIRLEAADATAAVAAAARPDQRWAKTPSRS